MIDLQSQLSFQTSTLELSNPASNDVIAGWQSGADRDEALARLDFLIENRLVVGIVSGSTGSGKTSLLKEFAGRLKAEGTPHLQLNLNGLRAREMMNRLSSHLGLSSHSIPSFKQWRAIMDRLVAGSTRSRGTVLLLDDCHLASRDVLETITYLLAIPRNEVRLCVVLATDADQIGKLGSDLLEHCGLRIELDAGA